MKFTIQPAEKRSKLGSFRLRTSGARALAALLLAWILGSAGAAAVAQTVGRSAAKRVDVVSLGFGTSNDSLGSAPTYELSVKPNAVPWSIGFTSVQNRQYDDAVARSTVTREACVQAGTANCRVLDYKNFSHTLGIDVRYHIQARPRLELIGGIGVYRSDKVFVMEGTAAGDASGAPRATNRMPESVMYFLNLEVGARYRFPGGFVLGGSLGALKSQVTFGWAFDAAQ